MLLLLYSWATESFPVFGNPHSPHFFSFSSFVLILWYTVKILQTRGLPFPCGLGRQAVTPREQRTGTPHLRSHGWETQQVTSREAPIGGMSPGHPQDTFRRSLRYTSLVWTNNTSSVSLHLTEKMKFEMKLPCWWQWKSKTEKPRKIKMKSCKYSRCRPHFFQLMEFYHGLATSKKISGATDMWVSALIFCKWIAKTCGFWEQLENNFQVLKSPAYK